MVCDKEELYQAQKNKITKQYTIHGKLSSEGVGALYRLAVHHGKTKEYFPEGYGTRTFWERD